jgi:hypothetical protein
LELRTALVKPEAFGGLVEDAGAQGLNLSFEMVMVNVAELAMTRANRHGTAGRVLRSPSGWY